MRDQPLQTICHHQPQDVPDHGQEDTQELSVQQAYLLLQDVEQRLDVLRRYLEEQPAPGDEHVYDQLSY